MNQTVEPFWRQKSLDDMSPEEWESLCDGCGRCCMVKLEDEDTGQIYLTKLACGLLDIGSCKCGDYPNRFSKMPDCLSITPEATRSLTWLPPTCGYRLVEEGKDLPWWHPLISGSENTVHEAGISVRDWAMCEKKADPDDLERYIIKDFKKPRRKAPPRDRVLKGRAKTPAKASR